MAHQARRWYLSVLFIVAVSGTARGQSGENSVVTEDSTSATKFSWSVLPIVFSTPETSWAFGVLPQFVFNTNGSVRPSQVYLALFYTLNNQYGAFLNSSVWMNQDRDNVEVEASVLHWPNLYYGIGSEDNVIIPENYTEDLVRIRLTGKHLFTKTFFGGLTGALQNQELSELDSGGDIDEGLVNGSDGGRIIGLGAIVGIDSRNHNLFPTRGQLIDLSLLKYGGFLGGDYDYVNIVANARTYHRLARNHTLALQAYLSDNGNGVPFWMMEGIGSIVRGYQQTRYIDKSLVAAQIEYRFVPAYRRIGFTLFAGTGTVAESLSKIPDGRLRWAIGTGIRFAVIPDAFINIRFDIAFGPESSEFYFEIGEAF